MGFADGLVGIVLDGRYRLDAVLGEGGMGSVFRAHQLAMDRRVAVKLLKPHLTTDEIQLKRFVREANSTQKVDSPHAVKVLDFGITPQRDYYMVLEYLDGRTVQRELEVDGPFAPARAVHVIRQALHALAAAHAIGLVHRDLKPDNILLMREGADPDYTKLLDFGVAKLMDGAGRSELALTQQGMVFGTPEFMSPEQACGHPLDGRSDLYSLAATLFAMLTGCALYEAIVPIEWLTHHVRTPPPNLAMVRPSLAPYRELDDLIQRCLSKRREDRPGSAAELDRMLAAIEPTLGDTPPIAPAPIRPIRATMFSPSTFTPAIPIESTAPAPAPTTGGIDVVASGPRGRYLIVAAVLVLGVIVATIAVATRDRHAAPGPGDARPRPTIASSVASDAGDLDATVDAAPVSIDAAARIVADAALRVVVPPSGPGNGASEHLHSAEEAHRGGNHLRQLAEADLALRADPKSTRAKFLLGDALVATGDLDRGCKYLRALAHDPAARARATAAGCP